MILTAYLLLLGQFSEPSAKEQQAVLERVREYAVGYRDNLQNFICTKTTTRSGDSSGKGKWKLLETQEQELTYVNHRETYRSVKVNGKTASFDNQPKTGYTTVSGEFSSIAHIFNPKVHADLQWDHMEGSAEKPTCVFRYGVRADSGAGMTFRRGGERVILAHHGFVFADCGSGSVTKLVLDVERDARMRTDGEAHIEITYGPVMIGSKQFLLPKTALDVSRQEKRHTKAEVTYEKYRKYGAESSIRFDGGDQ